MSLDELSERTRAAHHAKMEAAWKKVEPSTHWKAPIDKIVGLPVEGARTELTGILDAIEYFTATKGTVEVFGVVDDQIYYRVTAPGYWAGPAN